MSDSNKDLFDFAYTTITKNVDDTSDNDTTILSVNLKGELLVGDGIGPNTLDPSTGTNGDSLIKDSTQLLGVRWGQPEVVADIASTYVYSDAVVNLDASLNGSMIVYTLDGGTVNLPNAPPNGTTYMMAPTTTGTTTKLLAPGSTIRDRCDVYGAGLQLTREFRFFITYNQTSAQWVIFKYLNAALIAAS
jgi:hypothetical protein